jgi:glycosyltransferase involved in cell wall biosynthesis
MSELRPSRRRRVLMLTTDVWIDRRILHEAEALTAAGAEVIVLAAADPGLAPYEILNEVKIQRLPSPPLEPQRPGLITHLYRFGLRVGRRFVAPPLRKLAARGRQITGRPGPLRLTSLEQHYYREGLFYRPDIIHAHDLPMLAVAARLKKALHVPLVYDMHESYPDQPRLTEALKQQLLRQEQEHITAADLVITVNDLLHDFIRTRYNLACSGVVQNATTSIGFDPAARYDRFRADYPQLAGKFLVLFQGWIAPERNLETAIKAMARVSRPDVALLIMGYGDYARNLEALARSEGVADRVLFVPAKSQEELLSYSASADLGLIPYPKNRDVNTRLASPNKLYEFIAARLPILSNQLPFVQSVLDKWGFGTVADLDDVSGFAAALNALDRSKLALFRQCLVRDGWRFSWEHERKQLLALYDRLPGSIAPQQRAAA